MEASDILRAEEIRDFALANCPALDFFLLDGPTATSCANGSKVRGNSRKDLLRRIDAITIWSSARGFPDVDVDWEFEVIKGLTPMMTTLVSVMPFPSKSDAISSAAPPETQRSRAFDLQKARDHPVVIALLIVIATAGITFKVVKELRVAPLEEEITRLERQVAESRVAYEPEQVPSNASDAIGTEAQDTLKTSDDGHSTSHPNE